MISVFIIFVVLGIRYVATASFRRRLHRHQYKIVPDMNLDEQQPVMEPTDDCADDLEAGNQFLDFKPG